MDVDLKRQIKRFHAHWKPHVVRAEQRDEIARSLPWAVMTRRAVVAEVDKRTGEG